MCFFSQGGPKHGTFIFLPSTGLMFVTKCNYSTNELTKKKNLEKMSILTVKLAYREGQLQLFPKKGTLSQTIASIRAWLRLDLAKDNQASIKQVHMVFSCMVKPDLLGSCLVGCSA